MSIWQFIFLMWVAFCKILIYRSIQILRPVLDVIFCGPGIDSMVKRANFVTQKR